MILLISSVDSYEYQVENQMLCNSRGLQSIMRLWWKVTTYPRNFHQQCTYHFWCTRGNFWTNSPERYRHRPLQIPITAFRKGCFKGQSQGPEWSPIVTSVHQYVDCWSGTSTKILDIGTEVMNHRCTGERGRKSTTTTTRIMKNYSEIFWRNQKISILKERSQRSLKFITSVQYFW